jgi:hypothetical protein
MNRCGSVKFKPFVTVFSDSRLFYNLSIRFLFAFCSLSFLAFAPFLYPAFTFLVFDAFPLFYFNAVITTLSIVIIITILASLVLDSTGFWVRISGRTPILRNITTGGDITGGFCPGAGFPSCHKSIYRVSEDNFRGSACVSEWMLISVKR